MITATWDLFPADVTLPEGTQHTGVRVIVTDQGMVLIYGAHGSGVAQIWAGAIHGAPVLKNPYAPRYDSQSQIPTDRGMLLVLRGAGCGCGSPLKYYNLATLGVA